MCNVVSHIQHEPHQLKVDQLRLICSRTHRHLKAERIFLSQIIDGGLQENPFSTEDPRIRGFLTSQYLNYSYNLQGLTDTFLQEALDGLQTNYGGDTFSEQNDFVNCMHFMYSFAISDTSSTKNVVINLLSKTNVLGKMF